MTQRPWQYLYDSRWRKASKGFRRRNPLCAYCAQMGKATRAEVVDHIQPHRGDVTLFWAESNWQSLCKQCHDSVKAREEARGHAVGCGVDGLPVDDRHPWNRDET